MQHCSERLGVTCTVGCWPASTGKLTADKLRSWEDASWGCAERIVIRVDWVQETSFSAYRRKTWVGAVYTGVHAFCAKNNCTIQDENICLEITNERWIKEGANKTAIVSEKQHIDLLLALTRCFLERLLFLIILYLYANLSFRICLKSTITAHLT